MLVQFSVGNFLSFREKVTLSMVAASIKEHKETNVFKTPKGLGLLKSAVIYGANASGKSNLLKAMAFMKRFIKNSSKEGQVGEEIEGVESFRLNIATIDQPSFFEVVFLDGTTLYRYGFEVDPISVKREWLYYAPKRKEIELFTRELDHFEISRHFEEGVGLDKRTRENALFLSVVANFQGKISSRILKWFSNFHVISGLEDGYFSYTRRMLKEEPFKQKVINLIRAANLDIDDISVGEEEIPRGFIEDVMKNLTGGQKREITFRIQNFTLNTLHKKFDQENQFVGYEEFQLFHHESEGTRKLFSLFGPIIDTLDNGAILLVDALDAKLHPILTKFIIHLFHSETNPKNAQLLFNSHDTNLLNRNFFRRDQIWFTEKDEFGASDLYSLVDYNVRNDASYEKDYLQGKYGSIPYIGQFHFFQDEKDGANYGDR
ncbi:AAA family ATPase [Thermicanus aegyptius]|uniref:AAA family ATPase n=1 Tax=Thermicanus aegyptius TaxID=94009 RepID=UPI00042A7BDA|nr:ATP-binding protein [Thermicanus aegyptius]